MPFEFDVLAIFWVACIFAAGIIISVWSWKVRIDTFKLIYSKKKSEEILRAGQNMSFKNFMRLQIKTFLGFLLTSIVCLFFYLSNQSVTALLLGIASALMVIIGILGFARFFIDPHSLKNEFKRGMNDKKAYRWIRLAFMAWPVVIVVCVLFLPYDSILRGDFLILNIASVLLIGLGLVTIPIGMWKLMISLKNRV